MDSDNPLVPAGWIEETKNKGSESIYIKYVGNVLFHDQRFYFNPNTKLYFEFISTVNFLDSGIVLYYKTVRLDRDDKDYTVCYLLLEDGAWAKGKVNSNY